ncbi:MAG: ABC transporter permease [Verrucomicrobia subdivision 3 bacterium]|nr:ABC transporter permease [Limisphaerales bacterium]
MNDLRFAFRQLLKNPGFTFLVVLTLAFGIGANTAIYSVVNTVFLNPLPGSATERLVQIAERNFSVGSFRQNVGKPLFGGVSPPVLEALSANQTLFADFAWADSLDLERKTEDFIQEESGFVVSSNFFTLWNVPPLLGRTFAKDEAVPLDENQKPAQDAVIVISYAWWQSLFGGDPGVIGRTIEMSGRHFTVIGVMPHRFQFPAGGTKFWIPAQPLRLPPGWMKMPYINLCARLKPGVTIQQTEAMLDTVARRLANDRTFDETYGGEWRREWNQRGGLGFWVRPARAQFAGRPDLQRTLFGLLGAIGFVLLIVCANVANLTLARAEKRQQEMALRAALGASRLRLMAQLLTESVLLACLGGLAGVAVAIVGVKLLAVLIPEFMPRLKPIQIDGAALAFTLLISVVTGLAFGCAPAWRAGRTKLNEALKQAGAQATAGFGRRRFRSALVVTEFALALVLLTGAGLMIESVVRLLRVDPGFDPQNLLRVELDLPWEKYSDNTAQGKALYAQLHERLAALPGVKAVGIGQGETHTGKLMLEGRKEQFEALLEGCGLEQSDLFQAMRIPLRVGRYFDRHDLGVGAGTAIINETMARTFWPGEDALGKKFWRARRPSLKYEVVGVVSDIRSRRYDRQPRPTFYRPAHELDLTDSRPFVVIRTEIDPRALLPAIRKELKAAEPAMRAPQIVVWRQALYDSTQAQRTYMLFLVVFAAVGLLLAALGIYGVLAYSVVRRTREIGIRMAVGADRRHVLTMVMAEGGRLIGVGVVLGLLAAFWLTRLMQRQLFEVSPTEPRVFVAVVLVLSAVALLACFLPARRATRINPMEALRYE